MLFGVETEFFLNGRDRQCPTLDEMDAVFRTLGDRQDWRTVLHQTDDQAVAAIWDSPNGPVEVKNDFSTNICEVAFPPLSQPEGFCDLHEQSNDAIRSALEAPGLITNSGSVRNFPDDEIVLRIPPNETYRARLEKALNRVDNGLPLFDRYFYSKVCGTQVSLSISRTEWCRLAPQLYEYEHLVPLLFSTPETFKGLERHCLRHFIYEDNWPEDPYVGFPKDVDEVVRAMDIRPEPRTLKFANCISRDACRVEFRSCDQLDDPKKILEMVCLRLLAVKAANNNRETSVLSSTTDLLYRDAYVQACYDGTVALPAEHSKRYEIKQASVELPVQWKAYSPRLAESEGLA